MKSKEIIIYEYPEYNKNLKFKYVIGFDDYKPDNSNAKENN